MTTTRLRRVTLLLCGMGILLFFALIHPFLAVTEPVDGELLVVEGWLSSYAIRQAMETFSEGGYRYLVTVGGPTSVGDDSRQAGNYAELAANRFRRLGIEEKVLFEVPVPDMRHHRTYNSALAFRDWLSASKLDIKGLNIFTITVHARKSRALFRKALGPEVDVGIISATTTDYDNRYWWLSLEGIRAVFRNIVAYVYVLLWSFA